MKKNILWSSFLIIGMIYSGFLFGTSFIPNNRQSHVLGESHRGSNFSEKNSKDLLTFSLETSSSSKKSSFLPNFSLLQGPLTAYVANSSDGTVTPINLNTIPPTPLPPIIVGEGPTLIAITPNAQMAYVTNQTDNTVTPIDLTTNPPTPGLPILVGLTPFGIVITPDGSKAYVVNLGDTINPGFVSVIRLADNIVIDNIPVGLAAIEIAMTPDGKTAYVTNQFSDSVTPIDIATNTAGAPILTGSEPVGIAITPDGKTAFVANFGGTTITPIDIATNLPGIPIEVGSGPAGIAITPNGKTIYVTLFDSINYGAGNTVVSVDIATSAVSAPITVGSAPIAIAITPDSKTAYVTNTGVGADNTVTPIDIATNTAGAPIIVGFGPIGIVIAPAPAPAPVTQFRGKVIKNEFASQTDYVHRLKWNPSPSLTTAGYEIFADGKFIQFVSANGPFKFDYHNQRKHKTVLYTLIAVNSQGIASSSVSLTLP